VTLPLSSPPPASAAWSKVSRNYLTHLVPGIRPAARALCDALRIGPGDRVLDVACGPGTLALEAARLGAAQVTGVDFSAEMVALAQREGAGLGQVEFIEGDATALPVLSGSFEVVASVFGIIFAPAPRMAVAEMYRAVVAGGRAGIVTWPRTGNMGTYYETVFRHIPRPEQGFDPYAWGEREKARKWFGEWFGYLEFQELDVPFTAPSASETWARLRVASGRVAVAYEALDAVGKKKMDAAMVAYFADYASADGSVHWPREALMVSGTK
jgi:SAM-dependent methyltransferase